MSTLTKFETVPEPVDVSVTEDTLTVDLADGRTISAPLTWFPRLLHGTAEERAHYELSFDGIHWPDLNEDISVEGLLKGKKSGESSKSLQRWLEYRARGEKEPMPELPIPPEVEEELKEIWEEEKRAGSGGGGAGG